MTVGRLYAVSRLKRARVACLNTRAVNVSGSIDCIAFDKVCFIICVIYINIGGLMLDLHICKHKQKKIYYIICGLKLGCMRIKIIRKLHFLRHYIVGPAETDNDKIKKKTRLKKIWFTKLQKYNCLL